MPKKLREILVFLSVGILLLSVLAPLTHASQDPSISDLVLADLSIRNYLNNVSISLFDGKKDNNLINLNQDRHWLPASTVKTFAAMYAFDQISKGKLDLSSQYQINSVNVVPTELETPELPELMAGEYVSLDRLIRQMITQSDNTAFNVMLDILDRRNITNYIHKMGLVHSAVGSKLNLDDTQAQTEFDVPGYGINTTTAEDYSKAFVLIKDRKIPGANELYSIFKGQKINNMIPLFLPKNVTVAHKHGDLDPLFHDGGIISTPTRSYVLSIFTNLGDPNVVAHISQIIYTKDLSLVGSKIPRNISEAPNSYIDPMILSQGEQNVLGATDQSIESFPITASDLGIKASDILLSQPKQQSLPSIASNSPFSFAEPVLQIIQEGLSPTASLNSSLNQASKLIAQNKTSEAIQVLKDIEPKLSEVVKSEDMSDPQKQSAVEGISNTRFMLLGQELRKTKDLETKKELIKIIASGAKSEISDIQPVVPKAATSSNLSQKPLLGEVIAVRNDAVVVRSAGGQNLEIPTDVSIKARSTTETKTTDIKMADLAVGTSVALLGSSSGSKFIPSFALTKLDRQLIAPQPVSVLKIDDKNKVMVVSENGNPVQVNINSQTIIKGSGTNVSLNSIKQGDIVIIRGQKVPTPQEDQNQQNTPPSTNQPSINKGSNQPNQKTGPTTPPSPQKLNTIQKEPSNNSQSQSQSKNQTNQPNLSKPSTPSMPTNQAPRIIQSTSIQVIEKKQDVKVEAPKRENENKQPPKIEKRKEK